MNLFTLTLRKSTKSSFAIHMLKKEGCGASNQIKTLMSGPGCTFVMCFVFFFNQRFPAVKGEM